MSTLREDVQIVHALLEAGIDRRTLLETYVLDASTYKLNTGAYESNANAQETNNGSINFTNEVIK